MRISGLSSLLFRLRSADADPVRGFLVTLTAALTVGLIPAPAAAASDGPPRVLLITAHPDDETLFNLGRFAERGWPMAVALVTNGEGGALVEGIRQDYDPQRDPDVLVEAAPGPDTWLTQPPSGPRLRRITSPTRLAAERRREFLASMAVHRVSCVYLLSTLRDPDFDDNWDDGIRNWNRKQLRRELSAVATDFRPDLIVTLNPDETWAHPQHVGLGRLVTTWHASGRLRAKTGVYGLREHAWYQQSLTSQNGDLVFDRASFSPVLQATYERHWTRATDTYVSQSSHPLWLQARANAGLLPGYRGVDVIRHLDGRQTLRELFARYPRDRQAFDQLPRTPRVMHE